jgi:rare lipoprotein A
MIPKSGYRFSEKIVLKEQAKEKWRFNLKPFGFMALPALLFAAALPAPAMAQSGTRSFSGLCAYYPAHGNGLTAAHRTLPFGTRLRVTDPKTGRSVTVLINDRGPFGQHRVLDVSPSAARALGMMGRGVIFVQAEVL